MTRTAVSSDQAPDALRPYSQAIVAGGLVFCSGMAGTDPATGATGATGRDPHSLPTPMTCAGRQRVRCVSRRPEGAP